MQTRDVFESQGVILKEIQLTPIGWNREFPVEKSGSEEENYDLVGGENSEEGSPRATGDEQGEK